MAHDPMDPDDTDDSVDFDKDSDSPDDEIANAVQPHESGIAGRSGDTRRT